MKEAVKKLIRYDAIYDTLKTSFFYQAYKKYTGKTANLLYSNPSKDFFVIGVTGTNGKTTTVNLLHKILNDNIAPTLAVSTACIKIGNQIIPNTKKMTSLDVFDLQSLLATAQARGCKFAVLEVSSHGLDQQRFEGIKFDAGVLTNITWDHIDYHGSFENYVDAKKKLFKYVLTNGRENKYASFSVDDKVGRKWFEEMAFDKKVSYALGASAIFKAMEINEGLDKTDFTFAYLGQKYSGTSKLLGSYNVANILAALSMTTEIGLPIPSALKSIAEFEGISGRLEAVRAGGIRYFVDFAHTPDGVEKTLEFLHKKKGNGRLIVVFGAPGNRDKTKRPVMGNIAWKYADVAIATDDDPDTENRLRILNDLTKDLQNEFVPEGKEFFIIPERYFAIQLAMDVAKPGDIVVMLGKGHELVQLTNFGKKEWNDRKVLDELLQKRGIAYDNADISSSSVSSSAPKTVHLVSSPAGVEKVDSSSSLQGSLDRVQSTLQSGVSSGEVKKAEVSQTDFSTTAQFKAEAPSPSEKSSSSLEAAATDSLDIIAKLSGDVPTVTPDSQQRSGIFRGPSEG